MNSNPSQTVAFLDTNVVHYIDLYLARAQKDGLFPFSAGPQRAGKQLDAVPETKLREHLKKGLNIVDNLSQEGCRVEYSPASEIELVVGRARGKAIEKAAREGIPDRMWTRLRETDISERLEQGDLEDIRARVVSIGQKLDDAGIDATAMDARRTNDALELALSIVGHVYMGVIDSVIYANALVSQADHLVSDDGYFAKTVNSINTGGQPFRDVRRRVMERVAALLLVDAEAVALPDAPKWSKPRGSR